MEDSDWSSDSEDPIQSNICILSVNVSIVSPLQSTASACIERSNSSSYYLYLLNSQKQRLLSFPLNSFPFKVSHNFFVFTHESLGQWKIVFESKDACLCFSSTLLLAVAASSKGLMFFDYPHSSSGKISKPHHTMHIKYSFAYVPSSLSVDSIPSPTAPATSKKISDIESLVKMPFLSDLRVKSTRFIAFSQSCSNWTSSGFGITIPDINPLNLLMIELISLKRAKVNKSKSEHEPIDEKEKETSPHADDAFKTLFSSLYTDIRNNLNLDNPDADVLISVDSLDSAVRSAIHDAMSSLPSLSVNSDVINLRRDNQDLKKKLSNIKEEKKKLEDTIISMKVFEEAIVDMRSLLDDAVCQKNQAQTDLKDLTQLHSNLQLTWIPDADIKHCMQCHAKFKMFGGASRTHCRYCGRVVCTSCAQAERAIPSIGYNNPVLVCISCEPYCNS